jgi:hypothetical protein
MPTASKYEDWLSEVKEGLASVNMAFDLWQRTCAFDFEKEFAAGTNANDAAMKANKFWWYQQNKAINQDCRISSGIASNLREHSRCILQPMRTRSMSHILID